MNHNPKKLTIAGLKETLEGLFKDYVPPEYPPITLYSQYSFDYYTRIMKESFEKQIPYRKKEKNKPRGKNYTKPKKR